MIHGSNTETKELYQQGLIDFPSKQIHDFLTEKNRVSDQTLTDPSVLNNKGR